MKDRIVNLVKESGADAFALIEQNKMVYDYSFREICMQNSCGMYGKCWVCPPDVGDINDLMKTAQTYRFGVIYNVVCQLEDSFDVEGMAEGRQKFNKVARRITKEVNLIKDDILHLGVGACGICERCAKEDDEPCRFPDEALPSMESYGFFVSETAKNAGLRYINGQNTVTYFGIVLFN